MILLDASALIAYLDASDAHHSRAVDLLLEHSDQTFAASALTLAEVLVGPVRANRVRAVRTVLDELEVQPLPLAAGAALPLAEARVASGLPMPDCCVLVTALQEHAAVVTFDRRLASAVVRAGGRALS